MTTGKRVSIYLDGKSVETLEECGKEINFSQICQDALSQIANPLKDYDELNKKINSLKENYEEELSILNFEKKKVDEKIKKKNEQFYSIKNKHLELMGEQNREKWKNNDFDYNKDNGEKKIRELLKETFRSYINYFFCYQLPEGDEKTNENYDEEFDKYSSKFWNIINKLFDKFMKDYKGSLDKKYFELERQSYWIKSFVRDNSNAFTSDIFLKNENPDRYYDSDLYIYMPLKEIGKDIHNFE